jgi:hypothetical protein
MVGDAVRCTLRMNECPYGKNIEYNVRIDSGYLYFV